MSKKILLGFEFLHYIRESVSLRGSEARVREALSERAESESERSPLALSGERGSLRGICANICAVSALETRCRDKLCACLYREGARTELALNGRTPLRALSACGK